MAAECIDDVLKRKGRCVVVGGTNYYIESLAFKKSTKREEDEKDDEAGDQGNLSFENLKLDGVIKQEFKAELETLIDSINTHTPQHEIELDP
jgi:tRNA A37 N6-isopentenylltransferase MiaA